MEELKKNLFYLAELPDYQVASDYSDVRGWDVMDADYRYIGKVTGLLVNKIEERVVYLDVEIDKSIIEEGHNTYEISASKGVHEFLNKEGDDHLIIPIGMAILDEENNKVTTKEINYISFTKAKRFNKDAIIEPDYELNLLRYYNKDNSLNNLVYDEWFYKRKEFENAMRLRNI